MKKKILVVVVGLLGSLWLLTNSTVDSVSSSPGEPCVTLPMATQYVAAPPVPRELTFGGDEVPLGRWDVFEALDREVLANSFLHSNTMLIIKRSGRYFPLIEPILREMGVPDDMKYLCCAESNLVPTIKSPVGAAGLWQFMESTAREYGLVVNNEIDERYDLEKSTRAACRKLLNDKATLGSWAMVAAAYNGGMARVQKVRDQQLQDNYYDLRWGEETGRYVFRILALKLILSNPADYGFRISADEMYAPIKTRSVSVKMPMGDVAKWAVQQGTTYKAVRMLNPSICAQKLVNTRGTMDVLIPEE